MVKNQMGKVQINGLAESDAHNSASRQNRKNKRLKWCAVRGGDN